MAIERRGPFWDMVEGRLPAPPAKRLLGWIRSDSSRAAAPLSPRSGLPGPRLRADRFLVDRSLAGPRATWPSAAWPLACQLLDGMVG
ncbi:MAG TPA: hypothetical protein VFO18_01825, partial [Methylomirabilota bacterium]|nr:hypothetical protein [Methylomirabilota bacterium]